jgi:phosphoribosyl 1,2-cyclic phosphodiesterase
MMEIKSLASSSGGNCYIISDAGSSIMIEAGLPINKLKKLTGHTLSKIKACLVTHEHKDHSLAVPDLLKHGIDCHMTKGTAKDFKDHYRLRIHETMKPFLVDNNWMIMMFNTVHDAREPCGFYIRTPGRHWVVFITDSAYCRYRFPLIDYLMIECNYSSMESMNTAEMKRLVKNHMSLETLLDFLRANDLSHVKEIRLLHLSNRNADADKIKREVSALAGVPVIIEAE